VQGQFDIVIGVLRGDIMGVGTRTEIDEIGQEAEAERDTGVMIEKIMTSQVWGTVIVQVEVVAVAGAKTRNMTKTTFTAAPVIGTQAAVSVAKGAIMAGVIVEHTSHEKVQIIAINLKMWGEILPFVGAPGLGACPRKEEGTLSLAGAETTEVGARAEVLVRMQENIHMTAFAVKLVIVKVSKWP